MKSQSVIAFVWKALVLAGLMLVPALSVASSQTTTGSIRGTVSDPTGNRLPSVQITATDPSTNIARNAVTSDNGFYNLAGLRPARYELVARRVGFAPQSRSVQVLIGQTLEIDFRLADTSVVLGAVVVTAEPAIETKTSEVATNVTQEQVNNLPTSDRNFLDLTVLAPGTSLQGTKVNDLRKTFSAGAQGADQINVFIDGASYKNDILQGGVAGQDASRGNPFPRNAVQEFRVITQNYKAEYQKASSAIISATTKSGTNVWQGSAFLNYQDKDFVALDTFQRRDKADTTRRPRFRKPPYERKLFGLSGGGPIIPDRMHFFGSYEGNYQDRANRVNIVPPTGSPALDTIDFASHNGEFGSPFKSNLFFGKLTYAASPTSSVELSYNHRQENDIRDFGGFTSFESATRFKNDVNTGILKYNIFKGNSLNEAMVSFQRYRYYPSPENPGTVNRFFGFGCCAQIGSNVSIQDFTQKRLSLRDDFTYSGFVWAGEHVFKTGAYVDFLDYDIIKRNSENPRFVYEPWFNNFAIPEHVEFQSGDPNFGTKNQQLGAFLQDDWSPNERLTLNLGVRWDFETKMLNYDYVTPQNVVDSLTKYADRLFIPLDPDRYFTDGSQRDKFYGAFQPRVGASYALDDRGRTTLFGGWGIFYDRNLFDHAIEESFALQHPSFRIGFRPAGSPPDGDRIEFEPRFLTDQAYLEARATALGARNPEVKLIPNDLKPPKANQFALGVRQLLGDFVVSASYNGVRSKNVPTFYFADRNFTCPERSFGVAGCFKEPGNTPGLGIPGFSTILFMDDKGKTWYDALQVQLDRPYQRRGNFGWGTGLAYTFAKRQTEGFNDLFSFPNPVDYPKQVRNDERHRLVANWIIDLPFAWGIQFSGLLTLGSGADYDRGDRFGGSGFAFEPGGGDAPTFKMVDLRVRKDFPQFGRSRLGVTLDLFNAFNTQNLGGFSNATNPTDSNFGKACCTISDPRRLQLGLTYDLF